MIDEHKHTLFFNAFVLFICCSIGLYTLYDLSYSWPHTGCLKWYILLFLAPVFVYHCLSISYFLIFKKPFVRKKTVSILSLIVGILFAGGLLQYTQNNSLQRFIRVYTPMIEKIQQNMPKPCNEAYFEIADIKNYNAHIHRSVTKDGKPIGGLLYNTDQFILYFLGRSINIEGSLIFYDSTVKKWQLFQNNNAQAKDAFEQRRLTLRACNSEHFSPPTTSTAFF
ncbi:MAG: hypothetical protein KAG10_01080 [Methylococcales bacterium]|nr:hypothetical protein [Methylococcales bacterium]